MVIVPLSRLLNITQVYATFIDSTTTRKKRENGFSSQVQQLKC